MAEAIQVPGKDKGPIMIYALSTCVWCKKTKAYLAEKGIAYSYLDVDTLQGEERDAVVEELKKWNPLMSLPTVVIKNDWVVKGFNPEAMEGYINL